MKIDLAQKPLRDILREARWWLANRGDAPLLFEKELAEALESESGPKRRRYFESRVAASRAAC